LKELKLKIHKLFIPLGAIFFLLAGIVSLSCAEALDYAALALPARLESLGQSAAARDNGLGGAYLNPATLGSVRSQEILFSTGKIFEDYTRYSLGLARRLDNARTVWGLSLAAAEITGLRRIENVGGRPQVLDEETSRRMVIIFSLADCPSENFSWGLNLKYYQHELFSDKAVAAALDAGLRYKILTGLALGVSGRNLNEADLTWSTGTNEVLRREFQAGLAYETPFWPVILSLDKIYSGQNVYTNYGAEFWLWPEILALRAGLSAEILNLGLGFSLYGFSLDYAYADQEDLGVSHKISLGWAY
jgi:hypothetical protein